MPFHRLEQLPRLHDGYTGKYQVAGKTLLLVVQNYRYHLIEDRCPHLGAPLSAGYVENNTIVCARHRFAFDLDSGLCVNTNQACAALSQYQAVVDGNWLGVML